MLLDSLGYPADFVVLQVEDPFDHCVHLTSQPCSTGALILCNLPEVSLSQWCMNTCYIKLDTTKNINKLDNKVSVS